MPGQDSAIEMFGALADSIAPDASAELGDGSPSRFLRRFRSADAAAKLPRPGPGFTDIAADYRVIGGHMATMLAARRQLGAGLRFRRVRATESQARSCSTVAPTVS